MERKQHYMTERERYKLEAYLRAGKRVSWIAQEMGFCRQTIYNEIHRGECDVQHWVNGYCRDLKEYSADKAQQLHDYNQTAKGRPLKIGNNHAYADYLEKKMLGVQENGKIDKRKRFSPAAALEMARRAGYQTSICVSTLYSYIEKQVFLNITNQSLIEKGKAKKRGYRPVRRVPHPALPSISDRPEDINQRAEPGHKEIDLIVGCEGCKSAVLTIADRYKREIMAFKIPDKRASSVRAIFDRLERRMGKHKFREEFKSISTDNGSEFLEYDKLTKSIYGGKRFEIYYCHSYSAWEKGTIEFHNRLLRRFFPKGTDFNKINQKKIQDAVNWLNHYPRKVLGWKMPIEAA